MKSITIIILIFVSILGAKECINFKNSKNEHIILPIMVELQSKGLQTFMNSEENCNVEVYLPIEVLINSNNERRDISVFLKIYNKKTDIQAEYKKITFSDQNVTVYDLDQIQPLDLKQKIIKSHARVIANVIQISN